MSSTASTRQIAGAAVFPIALGGASWSFSPTEQATSAQTPDEQGVAAIHAAIDSGINLVDTAYVYTTPDRVGHSESLIARALASHRQGANILVATKGGHYRQGNDEFLIDARRDTVRRHCETSLEMLGRDRIWLYQLHWPDPNVPIRDAMITFRELKDEGLIENIGVSNFSLAQLEEARCEVDVKSIQNPFSPANPSHRELLAYCEANGLGYLAYAPLRLLALDSDDVSEAAFKAALPNVSRLAGERGISVQRLLLAWLLTLSPVLVTISGASRPESIHDSARAAAVSLSVEDVSVIDVEIQSIAHS